jgi:hypothetical protein
VIARHARHAQHTRTRRHRHRHRRRHGQTGIQDTRFLMFATCSSERRGAYIGCKLHAPRSTLQVAAAVWCSATAPRNPRARPGPPARPSRGT